MTDKIEKISDKEFNQIAKEANRLTISRELDLDKKSLGKIHKIIGKAVYNGYKVCRKDDVLILYRKSGELKDYNWSDQG